MLNKEQIQKLKNLITQGRQIYWKKSLGGLHMIKVIAYSNLYQEEAIFCDDGFVISVSQVAPNSFREIKQVEL